ncbi:hypothetical protein [Inquilinus sp.]|uniref:hypothetical protein n=1 Tax=Inquilinus sp. TaxID=1932117 RepID=UPI00378409E4
MTGVLDRNRHGFNIQRTRNLSDGSVELLGGDSDMARDILWRGIFKPSGPAATRLDLTTKGFFPFISETSLRRQILAVVNGCAGKG